MLLLLLLIQTERTQGNTERCWDRTDAGRFDAVLSLYPHDVSPVPRMRRRVGARARGFVANGLGCGSGEGREGFVERLASGLPEEELARDWPVSQPSSGGWAGQRRASPCRLGWVQRSVGGLVAVWLGPLGDEERRKRAPLSMQKWCSDGG